MVLEMILLKIFLKIHLLLITAYNWIKKAKLSQDQLWEMQKYSVILLFYLMNQVKK